VNHIFLALADGAAQGGAAPAGGAPAGCAGGGLSSFVPLILMFVIFYFMLIRPQQKKAKEHQSFLSGLKKGDQVVTRGGVVGRVTGVTDTMVTLEVQEKVRMRVLKSYIDGQHKDAASAPAGDKADKADKKKEEPASPPASS
jgi:preprotein translocase subunit YajC